MEKIRFGKTDLFVSKVALGGIPIQRLSGPDAVKVVRGVIDLGINFIDTANGYTDSEEKIGRAIKGVPRETLVLTSKSTAKDKKTFLQHIDLSLTRLGVDRIDLYQCHNLASEESYQTVFGEGGAYEGLIEAIRAGKVRYPAFSSHNVALAARIMREEKFAAVQLPFNYVDDDAAKEAIPLAKELNIGFIAMKPFGGGNLDKANLSMKYLAQFDGVVPDPGIEKVSEMEEIVRITESGERFSEDDAATIRKIREEFGGHWCHRCDYCQPCPKKIRISLLLNIESMIKRMPYENVIAMTKESVEAARSCPGCGRCVEKYPYKLNVPELLKEKIASWDRFFAAH